MKKNIYGKLKSLETRCSNTRITHAVNPPFPSLPLMILLLAPSNHQKKKENKTGERKKNSDQANCYLSEVLIKYLAEPANFIIESFNYFLNSFHPDFLTASYK